LAKRQADRRHQNVLDERCDDFTECRAYDYADRQVDNVASRNKRFEFL